MGKLKEKYLNNLSEDEMEDIFGISAFEYVELMAKYKDDENYIPTDAEVEDIEKLVEDYYKSKEFQQSVDEWDEEMEKRYWDEQVSDPFATQSELDELNDSMTLKYTDNDILYVLNSINAPIGPLVKEAIMDKLNEVWNTKRGY
jgi:hypothetical protein